MNIDRLNTEAINVKLRDFGFSQRTLAEKLSVSPEAVSKWIKGESFPRPKLLLQLAGILSLSFEQLVLTDKLSEPVIAFRKTARTKIKYTDNQRAKDMGEMLKKIVPHLTRSNLSLPSVLKDPINDYEYMQAAAREIRDKIRPADGVITYDDLISFFSDLHATLVPVLWGQSGRHENALHIYLPDSETTWVYLNLDTNLIDFKFWMAHELGHIKAPQLRGSEGEDFAEGFAGALLYPSENTGELYNTLSTNRNIGAVVNAIKKEADKFLISPNTVYKQLNSYALAKKVPCLGIEERSFYGACTNFSKEYQIVSKALFVDEHPAPSEFIDTVTSVFKTDFYRALGRCVKKEQNGSGFVQRVLDIPALDAREIYDILVKAE